MATFVIEDHMLDWHICQIGYRLEIKLVLFYLFLRMLSLLLKDLLFQNILIVTAASVK